MSKEMWRCGVFLYTALLLCLSGDGALAWRSACQEDEFPSDEDVSRFLDELRALERLDHERIRNMPPPTFLKNPEAAELSVPDVTVVHNLLKESDINNFRRRNIVDVEHRDPVEIHSRTNALGIPLFVSPFGFLEPVNERRDLLCWHHVSENKCDWTHEGFMWIQGKDYSELYAASSVARLTSPLFLANTSSICLLVVYLADAGAALAMNVRTPELNHSLAVHSTTINNINFWKIEEALPETFTGMEVQLELFASINQSLYIMRIASCEEKEQVRVITNDLQQNHCNDFMPRFDIFRHFDVLDRSSSFCVNGGVLTTAGCACVAGFTGPNCTQGCGPNSFGQDCGGTCSFYTSECRGKKICTPAVGCLCAPGYTGDLCGIRCDEMNGQSVDSAEHYYGADCKQQCGHCMDGGCDIYTGKCSECVDGYALPFCREKYVHTIEPPRLTSTRYGVISVTMNLTKENFQGYGTPKFYQVQYKVYDNYNPYKENNTYTTRLLNGQKKDDIDIEGLTAGQNYKVRIVLIADDFSKYDGKDIAETSIMTKCHIPERYDYNVSVNYYDENTATFTWDYIVQENWCPRWKVEISYKAGWKWVTFEKWWTTTFSLSTLTSNKNIQFRVRTVTLSGYAPYSDTLTTTTPRPRGKYPVENLKISSIESDSAKITWEPPKTGEMSQDINYTVTYKCTWLPLCRKGCGIEGESTAELLPGQTATKLQDLLPSARYMVSVAADHGPTTAAYFGTLTTVPSDIPAASHHRTTRSNSSATVFWEPVVQLCSDLFTAYYYNLFKTTDMTKPIQSGRTQNTNVTFVNLTASTDYAVHVHIETKSGWNPNRALRIDISTDATVPEAVRNLTVYKKGRTMLGMRWVEPRLVYGRLHSFTITYRPTGADDSLQASETVTPSHCVPWPHLYCHTLERLRPNIMYNISVSARSEKIQHDGVNVSITEKTKESLPDAPEDFKVINVNSNSLVLQWKYPNLANGVLRSFLISVEETEQHMQDLCCQIYPIIEMPVQEELPNYEIEISELHPASTYSVSVVGKTIGFGPSKTLSISTQPPPLPVLTPPMVDTLCSTNLTWLPQENITELNNAEDYKTLIRSRIIIVLYNSTEIDLVANRTGIVNDKLKKILKENISKDFYVVGEYTQESQKVFGLHPPPETKNEWGSAYNPILPQGHNYQLAAVQISEYNGVLNADLVYSSTFTC